MLPPFLCHLLEVFCPASCETCQLLEFPSNGLWAESRVNPVVGLLPLTRGQMKYMRKTAGYPWTYYKTGIAKELNITPSLDKIQEYRRNWIRHVNRTHHNKLPRIMKSYTPKQKEPGKTTEKTSGSVRTEQVNKRPNCVIATWWCHLHLQGSKVHNECQSRFGKWWQTERRWWVNRGCGQAWMYSRWGPKMCHDWIWNLTGNAAPHHRIWESMITSLWKPENLKT